MTRHSTIIATSEARQLNSSGFTLLELSIVLVIIGLVAGGVLVSRDMVRNSELRAMTKSFNEFETAIYGFQSKYNALPGDMKNATQIWARADNGTLSTTNCGAPETDVRTSNPKATCNGNGDGQIINNTESFRAWQHLTNSGLLAGSYSGNGGTVGPSGWRKATIGVNVPAAGNANLGTFITYERTFWACTPNNYTGTEVQKDSHRFTVGTELSNGPPWGSAFTPEEAYNVDNKIDDGLPALGSVNTYCHAVCATSDDENVAKYDFTQKSRVCTVIKKF